MIWLILGLLFGYIMGANCQVGENPKNLEKYTAERNQFETDIAYYKKLTRTLVDENKDLRKKIK
jgi:hypothetical protein